MSTEPSSEISGNHSKKYFYQMPNIVLDKLIGDPSAFLLYSYYTRVIGPSGKCWKSQGTIEKETGLSPNTIRRARDKLVEKELIYVTKGPISNKQLTPDIIELVDIWLENIQAFSSKGKPSEGVEENLPRGSSKPAEGVPQNLRGGTSKFAEEQYSSINTQTTTTPLPPSKGGAVAVDDLGLKKEKEDSLDAKETVSKMLKWKLHNGQFIPQEVQMLWLRSYDPMWILSALDAYELALKEKTVIPKPIGFITYLLKRDKFV